MNPPVKRATALLVVMLVALPARAQAPLVVGAVRDQRGSPVAGATVTGQRADAAPLRTTTDASGTFALAGIGIVAVAISCRYCQTALLPVRGAEPIVAIVRRYEALASGSPSAGDLESLPYAHVESAIGLRPFTLLAQTTAPYPGPQLSDRGLSPNGSLLLDDGVPNYDIVSGSSPYEVIPAQYQRTAVVQSPSNAFTYGDQAAGGIVTLDPFGNGSNWQVATLGSDTIARAQVGSDAAEAVVGSFSNDDESRQRGDFSADLPLGQGALAFTAGTEQGRSFESPESLFAGSFSFAGATFEDPQLQNLYASATFDRGGYVLGGGEYATTATWSDSSWSLGFHSPGSVSAFGDVAVRASSGLYDQPANLLAPSIGATLSQTRIDAGVDAKGNDYDLTAGLGAFWFDYGGGGTGTSTPLKVSLAEPSLQAQLFPNGRWNVDLEGSGSFTLPTFAQQYGNIYVTPTSVANQRNELWAGIFSYTDESRVRFSFEEASQRVAGPVSGTIVSTGLSAIWQVAPTIALRAWTMHVDDPVQAYGATSGIDGSSAPTVNALWLTYESTIRFDAIYRRDLLDGAPFYHVDGDVSGPIANALRWYAGVEDRLRRTFVDLGLRFGGQ